jgi:hypothetical protein
MKKIFAVLLLMTVVFSPVTTQAYERDEHHHHQQQEEYNRLKAEYYPQARNNEIYLLPQDFRYSSTYVYYIREFKDGYIKGQLLVGKLGFDNQEYYLRVVDMSDDRAITVLESGNPNNVERFDRLLIATNEPNYPK